MTLETAISAMSDLFCDQFGFDSTFRMAVEDQSPDAAVGRMERRRNGRVGETRRVSPGEGNEAIFDLRQILPVSGKSSNRNLSRPEASGRDEHEDRDTQKRPIPAKRQSGPHEE